MPRFLKGTTKNLGHKRRLRSEMTHSEREFWAKIRAKQFQGLKFRRQHGRGPYIVDFFCPEKKVVIEIDGDVHANREQAEADEQRENYLKSLGLQVIRYTNNDILNCLEEVLENLWSKLFPRSTSPQPPPYKGGGVSKMINSSSEKNPIF